MIAIITRSVSHFEQFVVSYLSENGDKVCHFDRRSRMIESQRGLMFLMVDTIERGYGYRFSGHKSVDPLPDAMKDNGFVTRIATSPELQSNQSA